MAKRGFGAQVWWMFLTVMALNFLGFLALLGVGSATGKLKAETFWNMVRVFRGTYDALPASEVAEFEEIKKKQAEAEAAMSLEKGEGGVYLDSLEAQKNVMDMRRSELELMKQRLEAERQKNLELRSSIEAMKEESNQQREILANEKEKKVIVEQAEKTERLKKTFTNMDPGDIAIDLTAIIRRGDTGPQYAVQLLELMQPRLVADVLTEIPAEQRQIILPLLENPYADMPPLDVVSEWKRKNFSVRQMKEYIMRMPSSQALQILRRLDRTTREDVWELISPTQTENG